MAKPIIIDGNFCCRNLTGVERYAFEICANLDPLIQKDQIWLYVPANAKHIPTYQNIKVVRSKKDCTCFPVWDHIIFSHFVGKNHGIALNFGNLTPWLHPGIVFIHDIYSVLHPVDFTGRRDKLVNLYDRMMYHHAAKRGKLVVTVSNYSRETISKQYHLPSESIAVIPNGWDHFKAILPDGGIFTRFPSIKPHAYYFTLGSLSKRKNLKWIAEYAEKHQDQQFVISGKAISGLVPDALKALQKLPNVVLAGYLSDGEVKALMQESKAFVFPSYFEGFGIPPLEALSCGAKIIVAKASCLPEIYGNCAHYIDPDNTNVDLDALLEEHVDEPTRILERYTYANGARKFFRLLLAKQLLGRRQ